MNLDSAVLYTNDIEKVTEFYRDFLVMKMDYQTPDKFVQFSFDNGVKLGIKKAKEEREKPGSQTIFVQAPNVEELYEQFKQKGAKFCKELKIEAWATEFAILDPDGNKIEFVRRSN
jgi:catechol 2,3-dioxygenase-like lactoylglutathione lyase family enzyme